MGWSIGYDSNWERDIGYGVPAYCDHPGCTEEINRGLSYVCGGEPFGGENGCGLYFCRHHLRAQRCKRCTQHRATTRPFRPSADHPTWMRHKLRDVSWLQWRMENPDLVRAIRQSLRAAAQKGAVA